MNDLVKEKNFPYKNIFLSVIGITSIRIFIEWMCFHFPVQLNGVQDYVRFYLENVYYFLILFLAGSLFVSKMTRLDLKRVMRFGVKFYPIIWLPPIIDHLFLGRVEGYYYARVENFIPNLLSLYLLTEDASSGIVIEVIVGMAGLFAFVYMHTRSFVRGLVTALALHLFLAVISTPDLFWGRAGADYYFDIFLPVNYFLPFMIFYSLTLFCYDRKRFIGLFRNVRLIRSLLFVAAIVFGVWARYILTGVAYLFNSLLACFSVFFLWQASIMVNDIFDYRIDQVSNQKRPLVQGIFSAEDYWFLFVIYGFLALSFAVVINLKTFFLAGLFLFLDYAYSAPPFRWRMNFGGNFAIGFAILISFFMGIFSSGYQLVNVFRLLPVCLMMFLFTTLLTLAKDIKDVEGDTKAQVMNLFTSYGKKDAKQLITALIFTTLNVALVFHFHLLIVLLSLFAAFIYYKFENIVGVYISGVIIIMLLFFQLDQSIRGVF